MSRQSHEFKQFNTENSRMSDENQDILDTLVKGAGIAAVGMFASKLLTYFYRTAIARTVGPEAYGQISIGLMIVALGSTFASLALGAAIQNFLPKYRERNYEKHLQGLVKSAFKMAVPVSLVLAISLFLLSDLVANMIFNSSSLSPVIRIFSLAIPFSVITGLCMSVTKGFKVAKYQVYIRQIGQNFVQLIASLGLIIASFGVIGASFGWLIGAVLGSVAGLYIIEKKFGPFFTSGKPSKMQYRKIFNYSYPLILAGAIGSILGWTDTFFIGYYLPETQVGFYNAALPAAMLMMMPYKALSSLVMPSMSEIVERDDKKLGKLLKTLTRWTFSITFPIFCLMALFSEQTLHILFGSDYTVAAKSLTILAFGFLYSTSVGHLDSVIKAIDRTNILYKNAAINFFVNIGLNILLIPVYGIVGAAIATTGSIIFSQTLLLIEVYHFRKILPFGKDAVKPVIAALLALTLTYVSIEYSFEIVPLWALMPGAAVFGLIYLITLHEVGGIKESEKKEIIKILEDSKKRLENIT